MPILAPNPLELAAPEREQLWQIVNLYRTPQQIALKAGSIPGLFHSRVRSPKVKAIALSDNYLIRFF
ncbi:hypothetical protein QUA43_22235 [Microcoleus sp. N9_B4]|uniref:hypothetical protein n=1 Tax=Microcoleus sp. N9_B4 TaxID=3055386 RepID=UPI002FD75A8D